MDIQNGNEITYSWNGNEITYSWKFNESKKKSKVKIYWKQKEKKKEKKMPPVRGINKTFSKKEFYSDKCFKKT